MRFEDVFTAKSVAFRLTQDPSNSMDYLGKQFFPAAKKLGVDLKWIKAHSGLAVALKPSAYDAMSTIRPRKGFQMQATEMPLFRESMTIKEIDQLHITRAMDSNDPFVADVIAHIYDDVAELRDGAEVAAERMRMALMAPASGNMDLSIGMADQTVYNYDYDPNGAWATTNYKGLTSTAEWNSTNVATAVPLTDIDTAKDALSAKGYIARYMLMNSATLKKMLACKQVQDMYLSKVGLNVTYVNPAAARQAVSDVTGLTILVYDKKYIDYDGTSKKFYPDDYVSIIGDAVLGRTWYGSTPEELTLVGAPDVDVALYDNRIAIAQKVEYGPPVRRDTTVAQVCLPSFEGMDALYVLKVD